MSAAISVLVVDDERLGRETGVRQLREAGYRSAAVECGRSALDALATEHWDVVLCALRMAQMDGIQLLHAVRRDHPHVDVILTTALATMETAVKAIREGAADYLTKPFHFGELEHKLRRLAELRMYRRQLRALRDQGGLGAEWLGIVGTSASTRAVLDQVRAYAPQSAPVLITGEPGTGKELVARAIHHQSPRGGGPFVVVACGAIPGELADAEIFGQARNGHAAAPVRHAAALERAQGGTLLLDDVGELPLATQARLFAVLRDGTLPHAEDASSEAVNVRAVAISKTKLADAVAHARFHEDLYEQFRALEINLAPLRERADDIIPLAEYFLRRFTERTGRPLVAVSPRVAELLSRHSWPGNVRELRDVLESLVVSCTGPALEVAQLPAHLRGAESAAEELFTLHLDGRDSIPFNEVVSRVEARLLGWALRQAGGQQRRAAEILGLPRTTFQSKLRQRLPPRDQGEVGRESKSR